MNKTKVYFKNLDDGVKFQVESGLKIIAVDLMGDIKYVTFENFFTGDLLLTNESQSYFNIVRLELIN